MKTPGMLRLFERQPEPAHLDITHNGEVYRVALKRSPRSRRFTLRVRTATRDVLLTAPTRAPLKAAREFAERHSAWIGVRLARLPHLVAFEPSADFLKREAGKDIEAAVKRYAKAIGATPKRIAVRDTVSRWGSCSSTGGLSFSWRLILAPPFVLDYLAAHEVAHLIHLNHSPRYWTLLRRACPDTDRAENWLKVHGASLHRFGAARG